MLYFKYIPYLYLVAAVFFIVDAVLRIQENKTPYISFAFAGLAVFMFFFRRRYPRNMNDRNREK